MLSYEFLLHTQDKRFPVKYRPQINHCCNTPTLPRTALQGETTTICLHTFPSRIPCGLVKVVKNSVIFLRKPFVNMHQITWKLDRKICQLPSPTFPHCIFTPLTVNSGSLSILRDSVWYMVSVSCRNSISKMSWYSCKSPSILNRFFSNPLSTFSWHL